MARSSILSEAESQELAMKGFLSEINCPDCWGVGEVEYARTPEHFTKMLPCERCEGSGRISGFITAEDVAEIDKTA